MDTAADSERPPTTDAAAARPGTGGGTPAPRPRTAPPRGLVFDDPVDRPSSDDTDRGWGDLPAGTTDDDFTRFLNEKPPHHL